MIHLVSPSLEVWVLRAFLGEQSLGLKLGPFVRCVLQQSNGLFRSWELQNQNVSDGRPRVQFSAGPCMMIDEASVTIVPHDQFFQFAIRISTAQPSAGLFS
jgi:hypothetical protein